MKEHCFLFNNYNLFIYPLEYIKCIVMKQMIELKYVCVETWLHPWLMVKKLEIAKAEFKRLESAGIIRRSKSP